MEVDNNISLIVGYLRVILDQLLRPHPILLWTINYYLCIYINYNKLLWEPSHLKVEVQQFDWNPLRAVDLFGIFFFSFL